MKINKKTIFLIPGFKQKATSRYFDWLVKFLEKKRFKVIRVPIKWDYKTMSDYVSDFKKFYYKNKSDNNYIIGFSYGAVIAFITASELKPKKIYLCSLSSDFKEDLSKVKPWIKKYIGKKRVLDIKKRSGREIAKRLSVPSVIFYGTVEGNKFPELKIRCEETAELAKNSKLIIVNGAPHDIRNIEYIKSIKKEFN